MENDLCEVLECAKVLALENPCRMPKVAMSALASGLRMMMQREYQTGMSQDDVRRYYGVQSVRTIQRWAEKYPDFPKLRKTVGRQAVYDAMEVITWKRKNARVFENL